MSVTVSTEQQPLVANPDFASEWKRELRQIAMRYHLIGAWFAVVINPVWIFSDIYMNPDHWKEYMVYRFIVSGVSLLTILLRKKLRLPAEFIIYVPAIGLNVISAYFQANMHDPEQFQMGALGYCALLIGVGMLVLWRIWHSIFFVVLTLVLNIVFLGLLSPFTVAEIMNGGGSLVVTIAIMSILLIQWRYSTTKKEILSRLQLAHSKALLQKKNKSITDSITYAQKIQEAFLHSEAEIKKALPESFIFFQPKDIVSGDFYWVHDNEKGQVIWAAADCTGHGVPGAFMSIKGISLLNEIVISKGITSPDAILNQLREHLIASLGISGQTGRQQDGMDIAICVMDKASQTVEYAGAYNPMYYIRDGKLHSIKGDRQPIGYFLQATPFKKHYLSLQKEDRLYIFSDGFRDQFGGDKKKKFMAQRFRELLLRIHQLPMEEQGRELAVTLERWMGNQPQVDDICVIGVKV